MLRRSRWIIALVTVGLSTNAAAATAQQEQPRQAKNVLFAEASFIVFAGNVSVNYERRLTEGLSARFGVGAGYMYMVGISNGPGALGMLVFTTPRKAGRFEAGLGLTYVNRGPYTGTGVFPAFTLGYRYQPPQGGFVFRAGLNWTYLFGAPYQVSFGYAF